MCSFYFGRIFRFVFFFKANSINVFLPTDCVFKLGKSRSLCSWMGGRGKIYGVSAFPWEFPSRPLGNC